MRTRAAVVVLLPAMLLVGCSSSGDAAPSTSSAATSSVGAPATASAVPSAAGTAAAATADPAASPAAPAGAGWQLAALSLPDGVRPGRLAGAGGRLWLTDAEKPATLYASADGTTWQTYRLTKHGLPRDVSGSGFTGECRFPFVASERGGAVTFVYPESVIDQSANGLISRQWFVTIDGDDVQVRSGAQNGFERTPAGARGKSFRVMCVTDMTTAGDRLVAVGHAQWYPPVTFDTKDGFAAVGDADGRWTPVSAPKAPYRVKGGTLPQVVVTVPDGLVAVGRSFAGYPLRVWTSADGSAWTGTDVPAAADSGIPTITGAVADDRGIVVVGREDGASPVPIAWYSADGSSWERIVLPPGSGQADAVVADATGFTVYGLAEGALGAWTSTDGRTWAAAPAPAVAIDPATVVVVGDGTVALTETGLAVSGLSWPTTP